MNSTITANHRIPGKPFAKNDPRINRRGRPVNVRKLARKIALEGAEQSDKPAGCVAEKILRSWARSSDPLLQAFLLEMAA
jgi:hypothetical protein